MNRGHGTQVVEGQLIASLCGVVQRVDKLVSVVPVHSRCVCCYEHALPQDLALGCTLTSNTLITAKDNASDCRYTAEVGDVVVGRVIEVLRTWFDPAALVSVHLTLGDLALSCADRSKALET